MNIYNAMDRKKPTRDKEGRIDLEFWMNLSPEESMEYYIDVDEAKEVSKRAKQEKKSSPQEIIIKPDILDLSQVQGEGNQTQSFRPTSFKEYVGQNKAKQRIESYIQGCHKFNEQFPHTFLSAPAGCGKTVFANILTNILGKKFVTCTGGDLKSEQQLVDKIVECEGGILFIDEAHKISDKIGTFMLPILEEGHIQGQPIKPFTCIAATTHKGNLSENLSALVQRFLPIELDQYNEDELVQILQQFHKKTYNQVNIEQEIFTEISHNCKLTPRIAIRLLREYAYIEDLQRVKSNNNIVKEGITNQDIKALEYLNDNGGCGKSNIAKYLNVEPKTYEFEIEPYLINKQFISVGSRRNITEKGKIFLGGIK